MAQRDDITVRWDLSPRLITIAAPSTEITIQDLHDTLREIEAQQQNLIYPSIIETAGKENLGGGIEVGLTATLLNACVSFESRTTSVTDGYATGIDSTETILTDSAASYQIDGVERGALIINFEDFSAATVIRIISETQLELEPLNDGITNIWSISPGDYYKIWNQISASISGGNLVAVDENGASTNPVCPTAMVQVIRSSSSSATNQNSLDIEFASFEGAVHVDVDNVTGRAVSGTSFPAGTARSPVNNLVDALSIINARGLQTIFITGSATIDSGLDYSDLIFVGGSSSKTSIVISSAADVERCEFQDARISGTLDGYSTLDGCLIENLLFFDGFIKNSSLEGTITLSGNRDAHIIDCHDSIPGLGAPTIDMGGSGQSLVLNNYTGGVNIVNKHGPEEISINLISGRVVLDSTVTNGEIIVRGVGKLTNDSTANVDSLDLIEGLKLQTLAYAGAVHVDTSRGEAGSVFGTNGLPTKPVNNLEDAITIAKAGGLKTINFSGADALTQDLDAWVIEGGGRADFNFDGYDISGGTFRDVGMRGTIGLSATPSITTDLSGTDCILADTLENLRGIFNNSVLYGKISVRSDAQLLLNHLTTDEKTLRSNDFQFPPIPSSPPTIDVNGGQLTVQGLDGYLVLENVNTIDSYAVVSMNSGHVIIDSSCTNGEIIVRGHGTVTDESNGTNVITTEALTISNISSDIFNKLFPFVVE